ncbi:MAG: PKD domain-containing protein [Bacteroidetes bacterium]|nr:PKD domain-containing protein [Bacteroidota bacterium]
MIIRNLLRTYLLVSFFLLCKLADATHIVGGEIYYDDLGGGNYKLYMKVYRDCINGVPPFDGFPDSNGNISDAVFTIFDAAGNVIQTGIFDTIASSKVPPTINSPCAPATAGTACVEEAKYEAFVHLPPIPGGYYIAYQRCCRNGTILNLINPGSVGATYWEHIPGPEVVTVNSSPRFTNRPPIYICTNFPIAFDHVATDPDGDSLVYSICEPFNGLSSSCPIVGQGCASVNEPPPYIGVPFVSPYTPSYPMSSNPAINININSGFLNGTPDMVGQWVVGICVSEYRHGQLIGVHHRDFQFNVITCPLLGVAGIEGETTTNNGAGTGYCNGFTISYHNTSYGNNTSYYWDFGDPSTLADTSRLQNPTYTFPHVGTYTVTLITNPGNPCADTATDVFHVYPLLSPDYITPSAQCFAGNSFNFSGAGTFQGNGTFNWDFGANANPSSATTQSVSNVTFNTFGLFPVKFTVSENGCTATSTKTIQVWQSPVAAIGNYITSGCVPLTVSFPNLSTAGTSMSYVWNFSDGTTSTAQSPVKTFTTPGIYTASLTVMTNQQCIDTTQVTAVNSITVAPVPTSLFNLSSATGLCFANNSFNFTNNSTTQGPATYSWDFGAGASPQTATSFNVNHVSYSTPGSHQVILTVDQSGCVNTSTQTIVLYTDPVAGIGAFPTKGCSPFTVAFLNQSTAGNAMNYQWNFSDGTNSTLENPVKVFSTEGVYTVTLTVTTTTGCVSTNSISAINSITVTETPVASFNAISSTGLCFNNNSFNFINSSSFFGNVSHFWDFGSHANPSSSTSLNVSNVSFNEPNSYTVTLTENKNGCIDKATQVVELYSNPVANIGDFTYSGCDPLTITFANQSTSASAMSYLWTFSDGTTSTLANPTHVFTPYGTYGVNLTVSTSSKCIDVSSMSSVHPIVVYPLPTAGFDIATDNQSYVNCSDFSSSDVVAWHYDFGDGGRPSSDENPTHFYYSVDIFNIVQTVTNSYGCSASYTVPVLIIPDFGFWVPNAFTPEKNDGLNDIFKPIVFGVEEYKFMVFNRWGEMIYQTDDTNAGWDGTYKNAKSPQDVYIWKCEFKNTVSKEYESHVGHVTLIR